MILHSIHDLSNTHVTELLRNGLSSIDKSLPFSKNYHPDFANERENIFNSIMKGRYALGKGKYFVLECDNELAACAGWNAYKPNDGTVALALTRAYVVPKFRARYLLGEYILPKVIEETSDYDHLYITANEYNSTIYQLFVRANSDKFIGNGISEIYKKFKPIGKRVIYETLQQVMEYQK